MNADRYRAEVIDSDLSKYQLSCFNSNGEMDVFNVVLIEESVKREVGLTFRSVMVVVLKKFAFSKADCALIEKGIFRFEADPQAILAKFGYEHKPNGPLPSVYFFDIEGEIALSIIAEEMHKEELFWK